MCPCREPERTNEDAFGRSKDSLRRRPALIGETARAVVEVPVSQVRSGPREYRPGFVLAWLEAFEGRYDEEGLAAMLDLGELKRDALGMVHGEAPRSDV